MIKVLDCTLRDGGYINNWNFGGKNIKRMLNLLRDAEVDIIECGFLSNKNKYNYNKSIFDTIERVVKFIPQNKRKAKYVCMVNYGEYMLEDIPQYDGTSVDGIRVAFHKKDVEGAINFCRRIAQKGYMLFIQPMVTINYSDMELLKLIEVFNEIKPYAFYIADSFGVMKKSDLLRMFYLIDKNLDSGINIGYHSHNNLQLAFSNAQALVEVNTKRTRIIDSSVFGMGRGAGNLNSELFIQYLNDTIDVDYKVYPLLQMIDEILNKIYAVHYWGYSLPHYLSSTCNCHPNYASYLADKNTLTVKSISEILATITVEKKGGCDKEYIEELYLNYQKHYINDEGAIANLSTIFNGKYIIVIAPGPSIEKYYESINKCINQKDTIAVSVNFISERFKCAFAFISNEKRFESLVESKKLNSRETKLILTSNISSQYPNDINVNYFDLLNNTQAVRDNSTLMLLMLLKKLNVKDVSLAGFDGYTHDNIENYADKDMVLTTSNKSASDLNVGIIKVLNNLYREIDIKFITPTKYLDLIEINKEN